MADNTFQIGDRQFKVSKINAMKQFRIVRRIAPILGEMIPAMKDMASMKDDSQMDQAAKIAGPIMNGLARLSDADSEMVLHGLLAAVEMKQEGAGWAKLVLNDQLMFDNLELPILLQAAGRSFMFNMSGFFDVLQRTS